MTGSRSPEATQAAMAKILLRETLDVKAAAPLLSELLQAQGASVEIDASQVNMVGAQCLQIILSAQMTWERDGVSFIVSKPSDLFLKSLEIAGLTIGSSSEKD